MPIKRSLTGGMPRVLKNHRSPEGVRLRWVWSTLVQEHKLTTPGAKRLAMVVARAWLDYEEAAREVERIRALRIRKHAVSAYGVELRRAQRQQRFTSLEYRNGVKMLEAVGEKLRRPVHVDDLVPPGAGRGEEGG